MLSSLPTHFDNNSKIAATPVRRRMAGLAVLMCMGSGGLAQAGAYDALHPFAALSYTHDDNLFRLADGNPGYDRKRGDNSRELDAGLQFSHTYGRQGVSLQARMSKVAFDHFTQLDYNGKNLTANLDWSLGNHWSGTAGLNYSEVLAPYTDIVTRERNLRKQRTEYWSGAWKFHPSWRVRGGITRDRYTYDLASQSYNNRDRDILEAGFDHLAPSGSTIGVQLNKTKYRYDELRRFGQQLVDAGGDQDDAKLKVDWRVTAISELQFLGGWTRRTHTFFTERDASGINAKVQFTTALDGHVGLDSALWRQFTGVESNLASYSLNTGASVAANWVITSKLQGTAQARYEKRSFEGLLAANSGLDVSDASRTASLGLNYTLNRVAQLSTSLYRESRSGLAASLLGNGPYHANGASINVNLQY